MASPQGYRATREDRPRRWATATRSPHPRSTTFGFLHLGPRVHGVNRYGRIIAAGLREAGEVSVLEREVDFTRPGWRAMLDPMRAAWSLRMANVVIVPYCASGLWSTPKLRLWQLAVVHLGLRRRTVAVLHDVYSGGGPRRSEWWGVVLNLFLASATVIHGEHDRHALRGMPRAARAITIPHFIEPRTQPDLADARQALHVGPDRRVIAMLGWIHPRKNYDAAIEALAHLGPEYQLWFIGAPPDQDPTYINHLHDLADQRHVHDRLTITGYVPDAELDQRLAAIDIGLCPYHDASASASMSTLLAARRPVIANDIPFARELHALAPRAVTIAPDTTPTTLATTIEHTLQHPPHPADFDDILTLRSPAAIARRYAQLTVRQRTAEPVSMGSARSARRVTVAFLHLGPTEHGINRYGRIVADALRETGEVSVLEHEALFTRSGWRAVLGPVWAAWSLRTADLVFVPYCTSGLWSTARLRLWQLAATHVGLRRRTVAVMHDVYSPGGRRQKEWWAMALNLLLPAATLIHGEHDRHALRGMPRAARAITIPHFIEPRTQPDLADARQALHVGPDRRVIAMLGWIHPTKNYDAAIEALAHLGPEYQLWFIGAPPDQDPTYINHLHDLADQRHVHDRLTITGYVPDAELDQRLAAIDIGLCPYHDASASASMSTLLAARRPVIANDIPFARELHALAPRAVTIAPDTTPTTLATTIEHTLQHPPHPADFDDILTLRSPTAIARDYIQVTHRVIGSSHSPSSLREGPLSAPPSSGQEQFEADPR